MPRARSTNPFVRSGNHRNVMCDRIFTPIPTSRRATRARHTIPDEYWQSAIPPFTLTVCTHLPFSSPHLHRTRPASSTFLTSEKRGEKEKDKRARRPRPPLVIASCPSPDFLSTFLLDSRQGLSAIATRILFFWSTCQLSRISKSARNPLVVKVTLATSLTVICLGHIGRVSRFLALCGPTLAISVSSAA